jgi:hypothetical protein
MNIFRPLFKIKGSKGTGYRGEIYCSLYVFYKVNLIFMDCKISKYFIK